MSKDQRVAIVTGASSGIGEHLAKSLAEAGARVVVAARRLDRLEALAESHDAITPVALDVGDPDSVKQGVRSAAEAMGGLDGLLNNAGIAWGGHALNMSEDDWTRVIDINVNGVFRVATACAPIMAEDGGGAIVNIGTTLVEHAIAGFPASAAVSSKAALHSLTEQLAAELGGDNIRVSTISTGVVETPLHAKHGIDDTSAMSGLHLLNRIGAPEDVADAVAMLAANEFITGTTLRVDGGHAAGHAFG